MKFRRLNYPPAFHASKSAVLYQAIWAPEVVGKRPASFAGSSGEAILDISDHALQVKHLSMRSSGVNIGITFVELRAEFEV